jgi:hypothetical protein
MDKDMQPVTAEYSSGEKVWRLPNRNIHREDGPAVEYTNGDVEWRLRGESMSFDYWLDRTTGLTDEEKVMLKLKYG